VEEDSRNSEIPKQRREVETKNLEANDTIKQLKLNLSKLTDLDTKFKNIQRLTETLYQNINGYDIDINLIKWN
jgi:hypothetical protein